jgi:hypothetical protein
VNLKFRQLIGHAADLAAIRALMIRYKVALDQGDIETVMRCHADLEEVTAITLDSVYTGRAAVREFFERLFSPAVREDQSRPPSESYLAIHGHTAVLVLEHEMRLLRPTPETLPCRVSFTLIRLEKDWRILSSHVSAPRKLFVEVGDAGH